MNRIDPNIIEQVIHDLMNTKDTHKCIALKYGISESTVEKINECKIYTDYHNFNVNIRREVNNLNLNVINQYIEAEDYYILHIIRTDKKEIDTIFSKVDYSLISKYKWSFRIDSNGDYRITSNSVELHRKDMSTFLLNGSMDKVVDHINRNTLDNRRENLRLVSRSINSTNAKPRVESKSNIRGVYYRKARPGIAKASWVCEWSINGKRHSKSFSIEKYGEEEAFRLAKSLREEKMKEMKI